MGDDHRRQLRDGFSAALLGTAGEQVAVDALVGIEPRGTAALGALGWLRSFVPFVHPRPEHARGERLQATKKTSVGQILQTEGRFDQSLAAERLLRKQHTL